MTTDWMTAGPVTLIGWVAVPDLVICRPVLYVPDLMTRVLPAPRFLAPVAIEQGEVWVQAVPLPVAETYTLLVAA